MGLLETAGRKLIQKGTEKFLKETETGKALTKAIPITNKPQTPIEGEGLSFGGTTMMTKSENLQAQTRSDLGSLPRSYLANDFEEEDFKGIFSFKGIEDTSGINARKSAQFKNDTFDMVNGSDVARKKLQSTLSPENFKKYDTWTKQVQGYKDALFGKKENWFATAAEAVTEAAPFASTVLDTALGGRYSASKFAKSELEKDGGFERSTSAQVVGTGVGLLGGYGLYGKIADATILGNKALQGTKITSQFQNAMRQSYARNPFLFNFTSNSAQEAIEYGVRKGLGDEDYSVSDFALGIAGAGVFSKLFGGKKLDSIFDNISTKDLDNINSALKKAKDVNPDISNKELFNTISDEKLTNGMTFGQLKQSFIDAGGKLGDNVNAGYDNVVKYFENIGVRTSTGAAKRIDSFLTDINSRIKGGEKSKGILSADKDISQFKLDVISDLNSRTQLSHTDVDEILSARAKEYGIKLNDTKTRLDIFDEAEEIVMREGSEITNLTNPKTLDGFKYQYVGKNDFDTDKLNKLQDEIDELSSLSPTAKRLTKIDENKAKIKDALSENGFKSIKEAQNARYRINNDIVLERAKKLRKPGTKGRITNEEKDVVRNAIIKETKQLEAEAEKIINKLSSLKSVSDEGDYAKIIQYTQLKQAIDSGDYQGGLKSFIEVNKPLITKKGIEEGGLWVDGKILEKQRAQADVNQITLEATKQKDGVFKLSEDEESKSVKKLINFLVPFMGDRKRGSDIFQSIDTPRNVMERVFGKDSHLVKIIHTATASARSAWKLESINDFESPLVKLIADAKLGDPQLQRKYMIYMTTRQGGMNQRITASNNLWIDENGKIWDDVYDTKSVIENKVAKDVPSRPDNVRKLTDTDIDNITKEIDSNPQFKRITQFLDNKFNNVASRLNAMHYRDTGVLIPNEDKYFPIIYKNANYFKGGEEPRNSLGQVFTNSVQKGFLNARKEVPNDFDINTDLAVMIRSFQDNQLYYLNMKEPILRAKRAIRNSNKKGINLDDLDEGIYYDKDGKLQWKEYVDDGVVEGKPVMTKPLRDYIEGYIEHIENRGVVAEKGSIIKEGARLVSNINTWSTISANVWSMVSQYMSFADLFGKLGFKDPISFAKGMAALASRDSSAIKYSGALLERMTEHSQGIALGKIFNKGDLKAISQSKWTEGLSERALEISLRGMRKTDGQVSYGVWTSYAQNFLRDNHKYFPEVKITSNMDELNNTMPPSWFKKMIDYADVEMNRTMGSSTDFTMTSQLQRNSGSVYKVATSIQKTFINRLLFLNHILATDGIKSVPAVGMAIGLNYYMETEREYWRTVYDSYMGKKEFKTLDSDIDFGIFTVKKDSHFGNILANNPSLNYDSFESRMYDGIMKKATGKPELSTAEIYAARAMGKFFSDNFWNPMNRYEIASATRGYDKIKNRNEKGEMPPGFRNDLELGYAITKMVLPGLTRDMIPIAHDKIFNEPLWQTLEDNYQLGKMTKTNPEKVDVLNKMSFEAQGQEAKTGKAIYDASKGVSEKNAKIQAKKDDIMKDVYSIYGVPTKDEIRDYAKKNSQLFKDAGFEKYKDLDALITDTQEYGRKIGSGEASLLPKNIEVIYEYKLKKFAEAGDTQGINNAIDELIEAGVIKDLKGTRKKVKGFLKRDKLLGY